ncbi:MAG: ribosomal protein L7/L12 [Nocardioides sp.]
MGLFGGGTTDRGELLELEARVARLEEQVARLTAALAAQPAAPPGSEAPAAPAADLYPDARALAAEGNKIQAIKVVRDRSGMSLRAAKDLVESW